MNSAEMDRQAYHYGSNILKINVVTYCVFYQGTFIYMYLFESKNTVSRAGELTPSYQSWHLHGFLIVWRKRSLTYYNCIVFVEEISITNY